jgi:excisionase family DNA binding protein
VPANSTGPEVYLSPRQAARRLGVSVRTLARWADTKGLKPSRTPGGHRRFHVDDLDALLEPDPPAPTELTE